MTRQWSYIDPNVQTGQSQVVGEEEYH